MCGLKSKTWFYRFYCNFYPFTQVTEFEEGTSHSEDTSSDSLFFFCVCVIVAFSGMQFRYSACCPFSSGCVFLNGIPNDYSTSF